MEPDDRSSDESATDERTDRSSDGRARIRAALVTVTMFAVLALIVIGVVRIVQS
jgi:predicted nucleic acid-binding Zn ribbon protein